MRAFLFKITAIALLLSTFTAAWADEEDRLFYAYDASNGLANNSVQFVFTTSSGRILVSTLGHINFFDGAGFTHADPHEDIIFPLKGYQGAYQIYTDHYNCLWIKAEGLMSCLDLTTEKFVRDVPAAFRERGVTKPVDDLYGDGEGHLWYRTGRDIYCPHLKKSFHIYHNATVQDVDMLDYHQFFMFFDDGAIAVYDYEKQGLLYTDEAFTGQDKMLYAQSTEICLLGRQFFLVRNGIGGSVFMAYDIDARKWTTLQKTTLRMNCIYPYADKLYIGTNRGYLVYDVASGNIRHIEELEMTKGRKQVPDINSLCFDLQGGMWIGTQVRGLLYAKPMDNPFDVYRWDTPEFSHYAYLLDHAQATHRKSMPRKVNDIFVDSRGWKWIGSYYGLEVEKNDHEKITFTAKDGLPNQTVHSIVEDDEQNLWVATSYGIAHLLIRDGKVYHIEPYINQDNIPNESFINGRALKLNDGRIVMQSIDHIVVFNPHVFLNGKMASIKIFPQLIKIAVIGYDIEAGDELDGKVITEKAVASTDAITVNYNQNSVALQFSALNYVRPVQTYYRVRIKGVPEYEKWKILSYGKSQGMVDKYGQLRLPLLGLRPGTYQIEMQASLWPETWTEDPDVWTIHVEQPWWRSTGIYLGLIALGVLLLLINIYVFMRNTHWRVIRNNEEADIRHSIRSYAMRCQSLAAETLSPQSMPVSKEGQSHMRLDDGFVRVMLRLVPFVLSNSERSYSLGKLAEVAGVKRTELYQLLTAHLDKSPRLIMMPLRLQEAAQLLTTTDLSVEEVARKCRFVSANFFIASFFHYYRQSPEDYRKSSAR